MRRLLIKKPEKTDKSSKQYLINDTAQDFHTQFGFVKKEDLQKPDGSLFQSNTGTWFSIVSAVFLDDYQKIKRGPQIIPLKDIGAIIAFAGITKDSVIVEGGGGSGGLGCFLAKICRQVISYEIKEDHVKIIEKNISRLGIDNQIVKLKDMSEGIDEKNIDVVIIDLPSPWIAIDAAKKAVRPGGFIISYSPNTTQVNEMCNQVEQDSDLIQVSTHEIIDREWVVSGLKVHPLSKDSIHSGFLTFFRRIT